jgi:putative hydrolase of the HAD superfamily
MVLTGPPAPEAHAALLRITGLPVDRFESLYWADRHAYDEGKLTGTAFWQQLLRDGGLPEDEKKVEQLNLLDAQLWTTQNPAMLAWQTELKKRGLLTAILSNMGDAVLANIEREYAWIHSFDVLVWSFQLRMAKPDPAIYRYALDKLGVAPPEVLFIDDKSENVEAAQALGINALKFSTVEQLRADLIAEGYDTQLPLPVVN